MRDSSGSADSPVYSVNEWSPLEAIVVGSVAGAVYPSYGPIAAANGDPGWLAHYQGAFVEEELVAEADAQLAGLVEVLEARGVEVSRPTAMAHNLPIETPFWRTRSGWNAANPRDLFLVFGDEIIECASPHRHRQYERMAYRAVLDPLSRDGARWVSAPPPMLHDALYDHGLSAPASLPTSGHSDGPLARGSVPRYATTELEPVWEAADFIRCGDDVLAIRSNVTNEAGIAWVRRHLSGRTRVHTLATRCPRPNHLDTTFLPLADGRALIHPQWIDRDTLPAFLAAWELIEAPEPQYRSTSPMASPYFTSQWLSMNVLSIDPTTVIIDDQQTRLRHTLEAAGFDVIPLAFDAVGAFGGSFHCVTLDLRRRAR
jgi:glycine amidinotransferase